MAQVARIPFDPDRDLPLRGPSAPPPPAIPPHFERASFANYMPRTPSQRSALAMVQQWVAEADAGHGAQLALLGAQGTGKSHLLYAAAAQLHREHGRRVFCALWPRLASCLRYGGPDPWPPLRLDGTRGLPARLEDYQHRDLLFAQRIILLDEVRQTANTAFDDTELTGLVAYAYNERIPLLITSNAYPLADLIGAPAASRFAQVVVAGPDARGAA